MAPLVASPFLERIAKGFHLPEKPRTGPAISIQSACLLSILFNIIYILPFYLIKETRPSPTLKRDAPASIRMRIRAVTVTSVILTLITIYVVSDHGKNDWHSTAQLMGFYPTSLVDIAKSLLLVAILFAGPLFEAGIVESGWIDWIRLEGASEVLSSWTGWRNLVAGPVSEEVIWRSLIVPLHLIACPLYPTNLYATTFTQSQIYAHSAAVPNATSELARQWTRNVILVTPLYFGIAHIHHFYEFRLTHPHQPLIGCVLRTLFQFTYTTLFGWFEAFVFVRTGSLPACILAHSFCNWLGLPRFWGRVGKEVYIKDGRAAMDRNLADSKDLRSSGRAGTSSPYNDKDDDDATTAGAEDSLLNGTQDGNPFPVSRAPTPLGQQRGLGVVWSVVYYVLLVAGAYGFYGGLWPLTESKYKLAEL